MSWAGKIAIGACGAVNFLVFGNLSSNLRIPGIFIFVRIPRCLVTEITQATNDKREVVPTLSWIGALPAMLGTAAALQEVSAALVDGKLPLMRA